MRTNLCAAVSGNSRNRRAARWNGQSWITCKFTLTLTHEEATLAVKVIKLMKTLLLTGSQRQEGSSGASWCRWTSGKYSSFQNCSSINGKTGNFIGTFQSHVTFIFIALCCHFFPPGSSRRLPRWRPGKFDPKVDQRSPHNISGLCARAKETGTKLEKKSNGVTFLFGWAVTTAVESLRGLFDEHFEN